MRLFIALMIIAAFCSSFLSAAEKADPKIVLKEETNSAPAENKILATINGKNIMSGDIAKQVNTTVQRQISMMGAMGQNMPAEAMANIKNRISGQIVSGMIDKMLLSERLKSKKIVIPADKVEERIKEYAERYKMTVDEMKKQFTRMGMDFSEFQESIQLQLGLDKLMQMEMTKEQLTVSDKEAKDFYDANPKNFSQEEQVRASHILVSTQGKDEEGKAEAKKKIDDLLKKVKDGGDFAQLAKDNSDCPSSAKGGDLDYFGRGRMVPAFDQACFSMKVGDISDVIETQFGYHIIKLTDKKEAVKKKYDDIKEDIIKNLENQKKSQFWAKYRAEMRKAAKITVADEIKDIVFPKPKTEPKVNITPKN